MRKAVMLITTLVASVALVDPLAAGAQPFETFAPFGRRSRTRPIVARRVGT
jgi:hypothetical protein